MFMDRIPCSALVDDSLATDLRPHGMHNLVPSSGSMPRCTSDNHRSAQSLRSGKPLLSPSLSPQSKINPVAPTSSVIEFHTRRLSLQSERISTSRVDVAVFKE